MRIRWSISLAMTLAACGSPASPEAASVEEASVEEASSEAASVEQASVEEASSEAAAVEEASLEEAPAAARDELEVQLRAFHASDLPSGPGLRSREHADRQLVALSETSRSLLVRARALSLLRHVQSEAAIERLTAVLTSDAHPKLLAAAVLGASGAEGPRLAAAVAAMEHHPDPRVRRAHARSLSGDVSIQERWPARPPRALTP